MEHLRVLTRLGFDSKAASLYLATLELGMAPLSVIARRANLKRPTAHEIMKRLCSEGIAECFLRKKMRYYSVISPVVLCERFESRVSALRSVVPELMAVSNALVHKPRITFFEGKEEVKRLYADIVTADKEALNYFLPEKASEYFGDLWVQDLIKKRVARGIKIRVIMPDSPGARLYTKRGKDELRTTRIITDKHLYFSNETYIYGRKVSMFSFDEDFALLTESDEVAQMHRTMFELAWASALVRG